MSIFWYIKDAFNYTSCYIQGTKPSDLDLKNQQKTMLVRDTTTMRIVGCSHSSWLLTDDVNHHFILELYKSSRRLCAVQTNDRREPRNSTVSEVVLWPTAREFGDEIVSVAYNVTYVCNSSTFTSEVFTYICDNYRN